MDKNAEEARKVLAEKLEQFNIAKEAVSDIEKSCKHSWEEKFTPIYHKGYRVESVSLGSDSTPEMYIPPSSTDQWTRMCSFCGKAESTTSSTEEKVVKKKARW